jgi:hypothetical protein
VEPWFWAEEANGWLCLPVSLSSWLVSVSLGRLKKLFVCDEYFQDSVLQLGLASNCDPPDLCLLAK